MYPHERSLVKQMKDRPFALIGVNSDEDKDLLQSRMKDENITWRSFWCGLPGGWGRIPSEWGVGGWPKIYLIDHKGVIRHQDLRSEALDEAIEKLVAAAEADR